MIAHPDEFLEALCKDASTRKKNTLELINFVCKEQAEHGNTDFSIAKIATLLADKGGPSEQSLRNKAASDYRALIKNWAQFTNGSIKKNKKAEVFSNTDDEILNGISDPTTKAYVGMILRENRSLRNENHILKIAEVTLYKPGLNGPSSSGDSNESIAFPSRKLTNTEIEALRHAISDELMKSQDWTTDERGRVEKNGIRIFKPGFITAIKKILEDYT